MPGHRWHVDDHAPLHVHVVSPLASAQTCALARRQGRQELALQALAEDDVPGAQIVPGEVRHAKVQGDLGAAEVKQHLVHLRIEVSGISVVLIISEVEVCEPSIVCGDEHHRLPEWTPKRLPSRSSSEIDFRKLLPLH
jgi:hypothetical protein